MSNTITFTPAVENLFFTASKRVFEEAAPRPLTSSRHAVAEAYAKAGKKARNAIVAEHGAGYVRRSLRAHARATGDIAFMELRETVTVKRGAKQAA
jgi:hypothetical protein